MKEGEKMLIKLTREMIENGLLTYSLTAINTKNFFSIKMNLIQVNPELQKFVQTMGKIKTSCGTKILPNTRLVLGSLDDKTGYPGTIYGIGGGAAAGNMFIKSFDSEEKSIKFTHGIRLALTELVDIFVRNKDGPEQVKNNTYLVFFPGGENVPPIFDYPLVEYQKENHQIIKNKSLNNNGGHND
jgi:hypothetical protein